MLPRVSQEREGVRSGFVAGENLVDSSAERYIEGYGESEEQKVYLPGEKALPAVADHARGEPRRRVGRLPQATGTGRGAR